MSSPYERGSIAGPSSHEDEDPRASVYSGTPFLELKVPIEEAEVFDLDQVHLPSQETLVKYYEKKNFLKKLQEHKEERLARARGWRRVAATGCYRAVNVGSNSCPRSFPTKRRLFPYARRGCIFYDDGEPDFEREWPSIKDSVGKGPAAYAPISRGKVIGEVDDVNLPLSEIALDLHVLDGEYLTIRQWADAAEEERIMFVNAPEFLQKEIIEANPDRAEELQGWIAKAQGRAASEEEAQIRRAAKGKEKQLPGQAPDIRGAHLYAKSQPLAEDTSLSPGITAVWSRGRAKRSAHRSSGARRSGKRNID